MSKDKQLKIRVTSEELETIRANATKNGQTVSEYVLSLCVHNTTECVHNESVERVHNEEMCTQDEETSKPVKKPVKQRSVKKTWQPYDKKFAAR